MNTQHQAYIALGANLGNPQATIRQALSLLGKNQGIRLLAVSSLYRTAPVGQLNQPDFINAVAQIETRLSPHSLLTTLLAIEQEFGRIRTAKDAPRSLDLDLLLFDDLTLISPDLTLPHPRLHLRAFVLIPLAEIAPDLTLPGRGHLSAWLPAVTLQRISRRP